MARPTTADFQLAAFRKEPGFQNQGAIRGMKAAIAVRALSVLGTPVVRLATKVAAVLERQAESRKQRVEDERLWNVALTDARVMADLSRAMSRDASRDVRGYY